MQLEKIRVYRLPQVGHACWNHSKCSQADDRRGDLHESEHLPIVAWLLSDSATHPSVSRSAAANASFWPRDRALANLQAKISGALHSRPVPGSSNA